MSQIEVQGLRHLYRPKRGNPVLALEDVNLEVKEREFLALLGPSGCGKSTLLYLMGGFLPVEQGQILVEGKPVAFMMTLPDLNEALKPMGGRLFPFNWVKLLAWLRKPRVRTMRVPLMGVRKHLQSSRLASQLAFMMIEAIRLNSVARYGATRGEIGWILEDNQGMVAIADAINSHVNKSYRIYDKAL